MEPYFQKNQALHGEGLSPNLVGRPLLRPPRFDCSLGGSSVTTNSLVVQYWFNQHLECLATLIHRFEAEKDLTLGISRANPASDKKTRAQIDKYIFSPNK